MLKDELLKYLQTHTYDGITVTECRDYLGTTECRKLISTLRQRYKIIDFWENGYNRFGNPTRWKRYYYLGEKK